MFIIFYYSNCNSNIKKYQRAGMSTFPLAAYDILNLSDFKFHYIFID